MLGHLFAWAAAREHHTLGGINNRDLLFQCSGDYKSKIKALVRSVSAKASLPDLQTPAFPLCLCGFSSVSSKERALQCLLIRTSVLPDYGSTLLTSFNRYYLLKGPISKYRGGGEHISVHNRHFFSIFSIVCTKLTPFPESCLMYSKERQQRISVCQGNNNSAIIAQCVLCE